jgi:hypothetical protein
VGGGFCVRKKERGDRSFNKQIIYITIKERVSSHASFISCDIMRQNLSRNFVKMCLGILLYM